MNKKEKHNGVDPAVIIRSKSIKMIEQDGEYIPFVPWCIDCKVADSHIPQIESTIRLLGALILRGQLELQVEESKDNELNDLFDQNNITFSY